MKDGWQLKKLSEVCTVERGSSPRPIKNYFTTAADGLNWIKIGDTEEGGKYVYSTAQKITPEGATRSRFVQEGDFILTNSMSFGRPYIMKINGYIHDGWFVLRLKEFVDSDYFYHLLSSDLVQSQFTNLASGAIVQNISSDLVKMAVLPIPPLPEQQRIVRILDEAFEGIATAKANAEKNLRNARELFESYLEAVFSHRGEGWDRLTLATLLERGWIEGHLDGNHGSDYPRKEEFISEGIPYISANCLDDEQVDMSRAKYLSPTRAALLRKGIAMNNDVLFAHNATVGPVAILHTDEPKVILGTSLTYYRCNPEHILSEYLAHYMRSFGFKTQYQHVMRQSTRNQVPITKQREFYHVIPPIDEQRQIVGALDGLLENGRYLATIYERKLAALDELKKSLLHKAFSGEL